jgi:hypothetical protein
MTDCNSLPARAAAPFLPGNCLDYFPKVPLLIQPTSGAVMVSNEPFLRQLEAFHTAILDNFERALRPAQSDAIALQLRSNALALTEAQLVMLAWLQTAPLAHEPPSRAMPTAAGACDGSDASDEVGIDGGTAPFSVDSRDHVLAGDALSRFVSRRLGADESPHAVWQHLRGATKGRRNPASPGSGFRSSAT